MQDTFKETWDSPQNWMTRRYALALCAIAMMAIGVFITFGLLIEEYKSTLSVVNVSGRQRMLSQRTALFVEQLASAQSAEKKAVLKADLETALNLMEQSHLALSGRANSLMEPFQISNEVRVAYFVGTPSLDEKIQDYLNSVRSVLNMDSDKISQTDPVVQKIMVTATNQLLISLDQMVALYEREGDDNFLKLQQLEGMFLSMTLLVLFLEVIFIFRPMVNRVNIQFNHIQNVTNALEATKNSLESTVIERTKELETARHEAVEANKAKSKFLAATGHDLKQPLEAMVMFTGLLTRYVDHDTALRILEDMKLAQGSMRSLLNSILQISKLEAGVVVPNIETFKLHPLLEGLFREHYRNAEMKGLEMIYVSCDVEVFTDPLLLERIVRNYLSNAVRYTKTGRILLGCRRINDQVRIEIHDTGPGIPERERENIFNEFSQLNDPERDRSEGIGLGLAVVKRLAGLLNHEINCISKPHSGSIFSVTIPLDKKQLETS